MKFKYGNNLITLTSLNSTTFQKHQTISIFSQNTVLKVIQKNSLNKKEQFLKQKLMIYLYKLLEVLLIYTAKKYTTEISNLKISLCTAEFLKLLILVLLSLLTTLKTQNKKLQVLLQEPPITWLLRFWEVKSIRLNVMYGLWELCFIKLFIMNFLGKKTTQFSNCITKSPKLHYSSQVMSNVVLK